MINEKIENACKIYGQDQKRVNLIAVSKTVLAEKICEAISAGCKIFGENYIKEAQEKWPEIKKNFPEIKLHFIGHLQSNKADEAVELFDCIQTLGSEKLALALKKAIEKRSAKILKQVQDNKRVEEDLVPLSRHPELVSGSRPTHKNPEIFIQVNIGEEEQKGGIAPKELSNFVKFARDECGLNVAGLMCIPPNKELASPYFALLAKMARENGLEKLSMGMSSDFEEAIALGASYVRIGSAIFGERK